MKRLEFSSGIRHFFVEPASARQFGQPALATGYHNFNPVVRIRPMSVKSRSGTRPALVRSTSIGLNRSRGRALRHGRASNGWNDERVLPDDEEGPEACPQNR